VNAVGPTSELAAVLVRLDDLAESRDIDRAMIIQLVNAVDGLDRTLNTLDRTLNRVLGKL
jgi:RNA processing factor Prp31